MIQTGAAPEIVTVQELRDLFDDFGRMRRRLLKAIKNTTPREQRRTFYDEAEFHCMALAQTFKHLIVIAPDWSDPSLSHERLRSKRGCPGCDECLNGGATGQEQHTQGCPFA
jgi:hypothetical protein